MNKKWTQILLVAILLVVTVMAIILYNKSNLRQNELESRNLTIEKFKKEFSRNADKKVKALTPKVKKKKAKKKATKK